MKEVAIITLFCAGASLGLIIYLIYEVIHIGDKLSDALEKIRKLGKDQKKDKKFMEIVTSYPAFCPYPEYKGKPCFSIRYEENGKIIEGFGTYNPEILSEYIYEYFMEE